MNIKKLELILENRIEDYTSQLADCKGDVQMHHTLERLIYELKDLLDLLHQPYDFSEDCVPILDGNIKIPYDPTPKE